MLQPLGTAQQTRSEEATPEELCFRRAFESQTLSRAPAMRALLSYLWQHRFEALSEYAVAVEALGRKEDFDPKQDATVRVQVARLRHKLRELYEHEAQPHDLRLSIPLGGHAIEVVRAGTTPPVATAAQSPPPPHDHQPAPPDRAPWLLPLAVAAIAVASAAIALLLWQNATLRQQIEDTAGTTRPALPAFWQRFLAGGKPASVVLPTPAFFYWEAHRLVVRDSRVSEFQQRTSSPYIRSLEQQFGPPSILQHYTVASDTAAALRLSQYMEQHGQHVQISSATELSLESFLDRNLVLLGNPGTSDHLGQLLESANFCHFAGSVGTVHNRRPKPGEPATYVETRRSERRTLVPGIISLYPGRAPGTRLLLLSGRNPASLVSFLISPSGVALLERQLSADSTPQHFEMVVIAEMEESTVLKADPVAFRPLPTKY